MKYRTIFLLAAWLTLLASTYARADVIPATSCPKPLPAKHHKHRAPMCYCGDTSPLPILPPQAAPEPDIEPIPLSVYPYYVPMAWDDPAVPEGDWYVAPWPLDGYANPRPPTYTRILTGGHVPVPRQTPEIDPNGAGAAFTLLAGCLAVLRGRKS